MNGDEKVPCEVATMQFIKANTRIPVPSVIAWGTSADNPLVGLGAFIIMEFIEGESLGDIWETNPRPESGQTLKVDISDRDLDIVYRQMAIIMLELSGHEFSHIGALSPGDTYTVNSRPVTWKMNEILHHGGVDVGSMSDGLWWSFTLLTLSSRCLETFLLYPGLFQLRCGPATTAPSRATEFGERRG